MRKVPIALVLMLVALPAWAQTRAESLARCESRDTDLVIAGCTALIQSGQETGANLAVAYNNRGIAYDDKDLLDQAIADYTKAIALKPDYFSPYNNRAVSYGKKGLPDMAIADLNKAIAISPADSGAYVTRGIAYIDKGLYDQAIADETKAIALDPGTATGHGVRGLAYEKKGQRDKAVADYRASLNLNPGMTDSRDGLRRIGATP